MEPERLETPASSNRGHRLTTLVVAAAIPLAFVALILLFFPFRYRIEFDTDEGINAIKAMMVLRGHHLYREIWSDQPPVFTYVLAGWFRLLGSRLTAGRLLVLAFSTGLIALGTNYLRKNWGLAAAVLGGAGIVLLPYYPRLSVSMMIGLPAIALAFASFYALAEWHARPRLGLLVISSLLLGLSILTKGLSVILAPIWFAGIVLTVARSRTHGPPGVRRWIGPAAWLGALAAVGAASIFLVIGPENLDQLLDVHLRAATNEAFQGPAYRTLESFLLESWPIFVLAAIGTAWAAAERKWTALYLGAWVGIGYGALTTNSPNWYHHQLFLTVPAALLASIAVSRSAAVFRRMGSRRPRPIALVTGLASLVLFLTFLVERIPGTIDGLDFHLPNLTGPQPGEEAERQLLAAMYKHADQTSWMFTDRPIFAFITGIPIPPNLSVISQKRMVTGNLTQEEIAATLEAYAPELILMGRFDLPAVREYMLTRNYQRLDQTLRYRLYFRPPS